MRASQLPGWASVCALAVVFVGSPVEAAPSSPQPVVVDGIQPGARALDCAPGQPRMQGIFHYRPLAPDAPLLTPAQTLLEHFQHTPPRAPRYEQRAPIRHRWTTRADLPNHALFVGLRKNGTVKERFFLERADRASPWQISSTDACVKGPPPP